MSRRGQANLPALAVALLVVTTAAGLAITLADGAFASADRDAIERSTAASVASELVASGSPTAERTNVLNGSRLDADAVEDVVPADVDARVTVDGTVRYERGTPDGGTTVRRIVLVAERQTISVQPRLETPTVTLPRRSPRATIRIDSAADVETVRANERVVLHDPAGLDGEYDVGLSRYETTTLRFEGEAETGDATVTYYPRRTSKAVLEVTVDA